MQSNPEKFSKHIEKLSDSSWLLDLAFLADITEKLNILYLDLQGKCKDLAQMMGSVKAFKAKLTLWMSEMRSKSLVHFPNLEKMTNDGNFEPSRFTGHLKKLLNQFEMRFQDFRKTETATAIARIIASEVENLELEIVDLKNDIILQAHATDIDFWKLVEKDRFPLLRSVAYKIKSCFGSTYPCESLFSTMNIIKSKNRSRLTDSHLKSCLRAGTSAYVPNIQVLVEEIQCQKSH
ncbi:hypothetical protein J437_LFUL008860 [Ladona fulva]|uniref:HAT C-terminal dimerisation domain-containing protein n=1 Tax=Ladona fulva TaxID=123851 RepID=A0A8K0K7C5_LADFU|nr:hypothetical protein J437_LFUL008860 [Ladona fulva]